MTVVEPPLNAKGPASVTIRRRVEWPDTDAAGRYHHSTVIRWVEAAEAELLGALDLIDVFGSVPRVRYAVDYLSPVFFRDEVELELTVESVGDTSIRYAFDVRRPPPAHVPVAAELTDVTAIAEAEADVAHVARGVLTAVLLAPETGSPVGWPGDARRRLLTAGPQPSSVPLA